MGLRFGSTSSIEVEANVALSSASFASKNIFRTKVERLEKKVLVLSQLAGGGGRRPRRFINHCEETLALTEAFTVSANVA